jgi:hypothetical protein
MAGFENSQLARRFVFLLTVPFLFASCFEYEERLTIHRDGTVDAHVRYRAPEWLPTPEGSDALLFPDTVADLEAHFGRALNVMRDDERVVGFQGHFEDPAQLDSPLITHDLMFLDDGAFRFFIHITPPDGFAEAISAAVREQLPTNPLLRGPRGQMISGAFHNVAFRFQVTFPGTVHSATGVVSENQVAWKVPASTFLSEDRVTLEAEGRLSVWDTWLRNVMP